MDSYPDPTSTLDAVAHIIQVALTPVFLLSGIAALLSVFATRLARVADRVDLISERLLEDRGSENLKRQLNYLRRRSHILDLAVVIASLGGISTCGATLILFVGALRARTAGFILFGLFGTGIIATICALLAFMCEMLLASRGVRAEAARGKE